MRTPWTLFALAASFAAADASAAQIGSSIASDPLGRGTWVVDHERNELALMREEGEPIRVPVGAWPEEVVVREDGTAFVSCRGAGRVYAVDPTFAVRHADVGAEPRSLVLSSAGDQLYVALVTDRALAIVDTAQMRASRRRAVNVSPHAMALTADGLAFSGSKEGAVHLVGADLSGDERVFELPPVGQRKAWHVQALVPAEGVLLVIHAAVDTGLSQVGIGGGYGGGVDQPIEMMISQLRLDTAPVLPVFHALLGRLPIQDVRGAVLEGDLLFIASRATKQLVVAGVDLARLRVSPSEALNLGDGTTGVAVAPDGKVKTFVAFERKLVSVGVRDKASNILWSPAHREMGSNSIALAFIAAKHPLVRVGEQALGGGVVDAELALGRSLFHDGVSAKLSAGVACVTCHPDGREDGLVWRLRGTRRQTPMLSDRIAETAPYNWLGSTKTLERNIDQTVERLGGFGLERREVKALARYISEGLEPVRRAHAGDGALIARGKSLFESTGVGCARCHPAETGLTDGERYDVESTSREELKEIALASIRRPAKGPPKRLSPAMLLEALGGSPPQMSQASPPPEPEPRPRTRRVKPPRYDVPSLRHVSLTAPYFHDGSVASLDELIARNDDRMGYTSGLSTEDRRALVAYLETL